MRYSLLYVDVDIRCQWVGLLMNHDNNRSLLGVYFTRNSVGWSAGVWVLYRFLGYYSWLGWEYE